MFRITLASILLSLVAGDSDIKSSPSLVGINAIIPHGRIVGGRVTFIEEHPWQVSIQSFSGSHICGGSIISKKVILTAAHCTTQLPAWLMTVRVGSSRTGSGGVLHEVEKIVPHEGYKTNQFGIPKNDIALLKLTTPIKLNNKAQPIPLFNVREKVPEGVLSTISGWGWISEKGYSTTSFLRTVDVPIVTKSECNKAYAMAGGIPDGQICAGFPEGGKDTCQGDSGGPLVIAGRQAGIVSWGNGCARKGKPGVYTEVAYYKDWIVKNAGL